LTNLSKIFSRDILENNKELFKNSIQPDPAFYSAINLNLNKVDYISPSEFINGELDEDISYLINYYGHRSDEFSKIHNNKHILYSGCSNTTGMAAPYKINWATMLHDKINLGNDFYRLSYCSGGYQKIILNLFKYFNEFGNPEVLFLLLPHTSREILFLNSSDVPKENLKNINFLSAIEMGYLYPWEENDLDDKTYYITSVENHKRLFLQSYSYLYMLKQYCVSSGIKLIYSTWDKYQSDLLLKMPQFNDMIDIYDNNYYKYIYDNKNRKDKYLMAARDGDHLGVLDSEYISNIFYDRYIND